jgi:CO dehydrogenase maturation factor
MSQSLGLNSISCPALGHNLPQIYDQLGYNNENLDNTEEMIKTTPPSKGSHLIELRQTDPVISHYAVKSGQLFFMRVGELENSDIGSKCYHSKNGVVELLLNHTFEQDSMIVVDMTAGSDAFSSGLFTRFDATFLVVEPTLKSVSVLNQYKSYADKYNIRIAAIGNKIEDEGDLSFLQKHCGEDLICNFIKSSWIKDKDKGIDRPLEKLEDQNKDALFAIKEYLSDINRDWDEYWKWAIHFHRKNAEDWANQQIGKDLRDQIDTDYLKNLHLNYHKKERKSNELSINRQAS